MNTRLTITSALLAGLLGGLVTRYITPSVAFAQDKTPVTNELRAQSFTLVDSSNRTVGTFSVEEVRQLTFMKLKRSGSFESYMKESESQSAYLKDHPPLMRVVLRGSNGQEIWSAAEKSK